MMKILGQMARASFELKRIGNVTALLVLCSALAACLLMPGKFISSLDVRKDGHFSFAYKGEIHFMSPSDMDDKKGGAVKSDAKQDEDAAQMAAMMGGMDLSDPKAAEAFARKLARQHGWRSVKSMGKGRFDVDYAVTGKLTHDFTFPVIEDFPLANPFVEVILRSDGSARVNAPAFSSGGSGSPLGSLAKMGAMGDAGKSEAGEGGAGKGERPKLPLLEGTFTVTTNGAILANNTEEGPRVDAAGSVLSWVVNNQTASPPTALISLVK